VNKSNRLIYHCYVGYVLLNIACGFLYGLGYGIVFLVIYAAIGLSLSFVICNFVLRHQYWAIKNLKRTFEHSEIIQTLVKVLNSADGYKIIFLSRLTPVKTSLITVVVTNAMPTGIVFFFLSLVVNTIDSTWLTERFLFD
jgi:uncharacterized membrane protein YdjX (TVP38/TMEM64 family)